MSPSTILSLVLSLLVAVSLVTSKTIRWTAAGGNPLWDSANNWDSLSIPTAADDVFIDVANIPGNVRIGSNPAFCNSLHVGGSSSTGQMLTILNSLTVGSGGGQIYSNGEIVLNGPSDNPFTSQGPFTAGSKLTFISGALSGTGPFSFVNLLLNTSALKVFNTSAIVAGTLLFNTDSSAGAININSGSISVTGTLTTKASVTLASAKGALLDIKGTFLYQGAQGNVFTILGSANIATLNVASGSITLNDDVTVGAAQVLSGASIKFIGPPNSTRKFGDASGAGSLLLQGGSNSFTTFTNIGNVQLQGGTVVVGTAAPSTISSLTQSGGILTGGGPLNIAQGDLTNADFSSATINFAQLDVEGYISLESSTLTVTGSAVISATSQFTVADSSSIVIASSGQVSQSAPLSILPTGSVDKPSMFTNNGKWTSTSTLNLIVNSLGTGSYQFGSGASAIVNGITFNAGSLTFTSSTFLNTGSTVSVGNVFGTGAITSEGQDFSVVGNLAANSFTQTGGTVKVASGNVVSLDIQVGSFYITGASLSATTLSFEGGSIFGTAGSNTVLTTGLLNITGIQAKTLTDLSAVTSNLTLSCGPQQCQLFTQNAKLYTKSQFGAIKLVK